MWIAGVMQGLMWGAVNDDGTLTYTFIESIKATYPYYIVRLLGGLMFLGGMFIMMYNVWKTVERDAMIKTFTTTGFKQPVLEGAIA